MKEEILSEFEIVQIDKKEDEITPIISHEAVWIQGVKKVKDSSSEGIIIEYYINITSNTKDQIHYSVTYSFNRKSGELISNDDAAYLLRVHANPIVDKVNEKIKELSINMEDIPQIDSSMSLQLLLSSN